MMELEHVDIANGDLLIEGLTSTTIIEPHLTARGDPCSLQFVAQLLFGWPVKHRTNCLVTHGARGHAQVSFEDLANVHTTGHAQWIEQNIHRSSVFEEWHILFGKDLGDH